MSENNVLQRLVRAIAVAVVLACGSPAEAETLYETGFSRGASEWQFADAAEAQQHWSVRGGVFSGVHDLAAVGDETWRDYRLTCRARCVEGGEEGQIWLSFRHCDEWNRYALAIRDAEVNDAYLLRYREVAPPEPDVQIGLSRPLGFEPEQGTWYDVRVEVRGNSIRAWIGDVDEPQIDYTDASPLASGGIALGGNYHRCEFDDVRVERLGPVAPAAFSTEARKFNFGPSDTPRVAGFELADGKPFDAKRGYGWDRNLCVYTRKRGNDDDRLTLDTIQAVAHGVQRATFMVAVEPGDYYVTAVGYDSGYNSHFEVYLDGAEPIVNRDLTAGEICYAGGRVRVADDRLDVTFASNHPEGQGGLSVAYLVVEPWASAAERVAALGGSERRRQVRERRERERAARREARRAAYRPMRIPRQSSPRETFELSGDWLFKPRHELDADARPESPDMPDADWHVLEVPDFWTQIAWWNMTPDRWGERGQATGYRLSEERRTAAYTFDYANTHVGWYRQWLDLPERADNERIALVFDAAASAAKVYVNGAHVGDHVGMFAPFSFDVTPHVHWGERNLVAVRVSSGAAPGRASDDVQAVAITVEITESMLESVPRGMYRGACTTEDGLPKRLERPGGLWQPVRLVRTRPARIDDVFFVPRLDGANIDVRIENKGSEAFEGEVEISVAGVRTGRAVRVESGAVDKVGLDIGVESPKLWSPREPNLYPLAVRLVADGTILDERIENVGFRTVGVRDGTFYLNGRPHWFGGANMPPAGLRPNDGELATKFFRYMHEGNQFITRAHGAPFTKPWIRAADREGVALSLEGTWPWLMIQGTPIPDEALLDVWRAEMRDLVRDLRNHPSVVMWTIGNELHPEMGAEGTPQWLAKWKIISDMIEEVRRLDPTRPVCSFSGYERHAELYRDMMVPAAIDDGDFIDPHRYNGWYEPSVWAHGMYDGGYLRHDPSGRHRGGDGETRSGTDHGVQALLSQEGSTGYPNDDTGHPERMYIQLYVPQCWVGDDAYEHRDPAPFLAHQALVTKEWLEDIRRTRRTAGWMAFSNGCWYKNAHHAEHIRPYPVHDAARLALQDVLPSLDQRNRHVYAGDVFEGAVVVVHDNPAVDVLGDLVCEVKIETPTGRRFETTVALSDCDYHGSVKASFSIPTGTDLPVDRQPATLRLILISDGGIVGENDYRLLLARRAYAFGPLDKAPDVCLIKGTYMTAEALSRLGCAVSGDSRSLPAGAVAIWEGVDLPDADSEQGRRLLRYVEEGGTLLLLETGEAEKLLPGKPIVSSQIWYGEGKPYNNLDPHHEYVGMEQPGHPMFDGLGRHDLKWWNGLPDDPHPNSPYVCRVSYELASDADGLLPLGEIVPVHSYAWTGPKRCPLFVLEHGAGRIVVSELRTSACLSDPLAGRFLRNLVAWAGSTATSRREGVQRK